MSDWWTVGLERRRVRTDTAGGRPIPDALVGLTTLCSRSIVTPDSAVNIVKSTRRYEAWMQSHTWLVPADLRLKHQRMKEGPFPFLRSTFYRWMQIWPTVDPELANAPRVLGVGDLHGKFRHLAGHRRPPRLGCE